MPEAGFFEQKRGSPTGFALVVAAHVAALGALALVKGPEFIRPLNPPLVITPIDIPDDPPPVEPPRPRPEPQQPSRHDGRTDARPRTDGFHHNPAPAAAADLRHQAAGPGTRCAVRDPTPVRREAELIPRDLQPPYPTAEQRAQRSGTVRVRLTIGPDGRVTAAERLRRPPMPSGGSPSGITLPDKRLRQEFAELLRDLVARGRAAGVIVVAATQKPGADVVPSALRDLFGFRLALRCNTPQASDTILGQGWASAGADASQIPGGQRGVGLLLAEDDRPVRLKCFYLADHDVQTIAERAAVPPRRRLARCRRRGCARRRAGMTTTAMPTSGVLAEVLERASDPDGVGALRAPAPLSGLLPASGAAARPGRRDRRGDR